MLYGIMTKMTDDDAKPSPSRRARNKRWAELIYRCLHAFEHLKTPRRARRLYV